MKCQYCGAELFPKGKGRPPKYCSDECRRSADRDNKRINYVGKRQKTCIQCGVELPKFKTKFCSKRCELIYEGKILNHGELEKECEICGRPFKTFKSRKVTCSPRCSSIRAWRKRENQGIKIDYDITLESLAERDKNICQLCGKKVNWRDYEIRDGKTICLDNYPSIDHIRPISKGGLHSWDNVQLAHRKCNSLKSDKEQVT